MMYQAIKMAFETIQTGFRMGCVSGLAKSVNGDYEAAGKPEQPKYYMKEHMISGQTVPLLGMHHMMILKLLWHVLQKHYQMEQEAHVRHYQNMHLRSILKNMDKK